ncbi:hypothetical protein [Pararhodobacter aggregans]|uniref:Uncharacterized protein n=1 Tax=Pararhodobacter aggregans TaxID=404875 RepID=A0A2T7UNN1_9RHOB|nr:hypothetical protein [Pararhodobacter aggregans]PTX00732.1 hypothetical protein C8N33_10974 [Pararhodobacter aggregans]PVE46267.1 hypothetical protein DDE23_16605 [Pararhodobacter aggregans]
MKRRFSALAVAGIALLLAAPAAATISRGCSASIAVMGPNIYNNLQPLIEMDASGTCSNGRPNQCRVNAHGALRACIGALWNERRSHAIPAACLASVGGNNRMNWTRWVGIYPHLPHGQNSLLDRVRVEACCPTDRFDVVHVLVRYGIDGDNGCAGQVDGRFRTVDQGDLDANFRIDCGAQRARGLCGPIRRTNP